MVANAKFLELLDNLKAATLQGKLGWEETISEDVFRVVSDYATVEVGKDFKDFSEPYYFARIMDRKGRDVEYMTIPAGLKDNVLEELYGLAQRSARRADDLLDRMIAELSKKGTSERSIQDETKRRP